MRTSKGFAAALAVVGGGAVGLAGCSASALPTPPAASSSTPRAATSTAVAAAPVSPRLRTDARAAAAQAFGLYTAGQFTAFWKLLSPASKHRISKNAWVSVHEACSSAEGGKPVTVKAVTVFGNAAIVTEAITGPSPQTTEVVFNYVNGQWSYSPVDPSLYSHKTVAADIAAAKAAGFCGGWKIF
jgi:hypothetical protein